MKLKGTLLFCAVSDEEAGGEDGAKYVHVDGLGGNRVRWVVLGN